MEGEEPDISLEQEVRKNIIDIFYFYKNIFPLKYWIIIQIRST